MLHLKGNEGGHKENVVQMIISIIITCAIFHDLTLTLDKPKTQTNETNILRHCFKHCTHITKLMVFTEIVLTPILFYLPWQLKQLQLGEISHTV